MSVAGSQQHTLLALLAQLQPHWRSDRALPARIRVLLARDPRFGSRDRRLYRELLYTAIRYLPWIEAVFPHDPARAVALIAWLAAEIPATKRFRAEIVAGGPPCPTSLAERAAVLAELQGAARAGETAPEKPVSGGVAPSDASVASDDNTAANSAAASLVPSIPALRASFDPGALLPSWFREHCPELFEPNQLDAMLSRAPLWLRVDATDRTRVTHEFDQLGWRWIASPVLPSAIQMVDEVDVTTTVAYQQGHVEVQDLGSQLLLASNGIATGGRWLDACAGAGGKTLQLAVMLGSTGQVDAFDIRSAALDELTTRARRAGLVIERGGPSRRGAATERPPRDPSAGSTAPGASVRIVTAVEARDYDGVLVDAPCSGSGTWRRAPHLKWTTTPAHVERAAGVQRELLDRFSQHVRPGGRLIYATCSLSCRENEDVVAAFLSSHPEFSAAAPAEDFGAVIRGGGLTFLPGRHNTDGFFVASLVRASAPTSG